MGRADGVYKWSSEDAGFLKQIMEDFADDDVKSIVNQCSAQSGKTEMMFVLVMWCFAESPASVAWITNNEDMGKEISINRLEPSFLRTEPIRAIMPTGKRTNTTLKKFFPGGMFKIGSAETKADLQSTPLKRLFLDEVRSWPAGALPMVLKRLRGQPYGSKAVMVSTPDWEGDVMDSEFHKGSQCIWLTRCISCDQEFHLYWAEPKVRGGLRWDENEVTRPGGEWDYDAVVASVRYECPHCDRDYRDIEPLRPERKHFARIGRWLSRNPLAGRAYRSYHWNALLPPWTTWSEQVVEFLEAERAAERGDFGPLKSHMNETRGGAWNDRMEGMRAARSLKALVVDYDMSDPEGPLHPENPEDEDQFREARRFMMIDVQMRNGLHFYYTNRAWTKQSWSRLLTYGVVHSWDELREIQREWKVKDIDVGLDSGNPQRLVVRYCVKYGWRPMKGDKPEFFTHRIDRGPMKGKMVRKLWSVTKLDPEIGLANKVGTTRMRPIDQFRYAKPGCLDVLDTALRGYLEWQIHPETCEEYMSQVSAYRRARELRMEMAEGVGEKKKSFGKSKTKVVTPPAKLFEQVKAMDHYASCEMMQIMAANAAGLLPLAEEAAEAAEEAAEAA